MWAFKRIYSGLPFLALPVHRPASMCELWDIGNSLYPVGFMSISHAGSIVWRVDLMLQCRVWDAAGNVNMALPSSISSCRTLLRPNDINRRTQGWHDVSPVMDSHHRHVSSCSHACTWVTLFDTRWSRCVAHCTYHFCTTPQTDNVNQKIRFQHFRPDLTCGLTRPVDNTAIDGGAKCRWSK